MASPSSRLKCPHQTTVEMMGGIPSHAPMATPCGAPAFVFPFRALAGGQQRQRKGTRCHGNREVQPSVPKRKRNRTEMTAAIRGAAGTTMVLVDKGSSEQRLKDGRRYGTGLTGVVVPPRSSVAKENKRYQDRNTWR